MKPTPELPQQQHGTHRPLPFIAPYRAIGYTVYDNRLRMVAHVPPLDRRRDESVADEHRLRCFQAGRLAVLLNIESEIAVLAINGQKLMKIRDSKDLQVVAKTIMDISDRVLARMSAEFITPPREVSPLREWIATRLARWLCR